MRTKGGTGVPPVVTCKLHSATTKLIHYEEAGRQEIEIID